MLFQDTCCLVWMLSNLVKTSAWEVFHGIQLILPTKNSEKLKKKKGGLQYNTQSLMFEGLLFLSKKGNLSIFYEI